MLDKIRRILSGHDKKSIVMRTLLKYGLRINEKKEVFCGEIKISYSSIARASKVDRRTVKKAIEEILEDHDLRNFFLNLEPAGSFLRGVAKLLGYRCIVIDVVRDRPGIVASISESLARRNINIVQVVAEDPNIYPQQKLYVIVSGDVPGETIEEILRNPIIKSITMF